MPNLNRDLVFGLVIGFVLCHCFHHFAPASLVAGSHGMKGQS